MGCFIPVIIIDQLLTWLFLKRTCSLLYHRL